MSPVILQLTLPGYRILRVVSNDLMRVELVAMWSLQAWLTRLVEAMHGRIHGFNVSVARVWADQERTLGLAGQRMPVEDSYIAATARRHNLTIVTGDDRDFRRPGLKVFNPFREDAE